ncbi:hypothetical protein GCM10009798_01090 [Nocardioides panacihumi]|uniref:Nucleotidyltransferase family protein n=1 Tax=Nocardioides panacihumi TaxID=400774 RepID=A0ABN2Q7F4_9ACTN
MTTPSGRPSATALSQPEGIALAHALTARLARDCGVRALAMKGPVSAHHGWRNPRHSSDADLLVEPSGLAPLLSRLGELGWQQKPRYADHSVTLTHPLWPCELDVHDRFPGFLAEPDVVFDALWRTRSTIELAHSPQPCTGPVGSAVVAALHALREPEHGRHFHEFEHLVARLQERPQMREPIQALARETGALRTLAPLFDRLGWAVTADPPALHSEAYAAWELRRTSGTTAGVTWLLRLRSAPVVRWPALVPEMLLGREDRLRERFPQLPAGRRALWLARWWRLRAAVRDLPAAFAAIRRYTRTRSAG